MTNKKLLLLLTGLVILTLVLSGCGSNSGSNSTRQYLLTVNTIGEGTITIANHELSDGAETRIDEDATVILEVSGETGWEFNQWRGENGEEVVEEEGSFKLLMDGDKEITAVFVETATIRVVPLSPVAEPDSDEPDIYHLISQAIDNAVAGDVIEICEGTYKENLTINKDITLRSTYPLDPDVREATVIDGDNSDSVLKLYGESHVYGFKIINGDSLYYAGGIYIKGNSSLVEYNNIIGNIGDGGGITINEADTPIISNNIITENISHDGGGIKIIESTPVITNNIISENLADQDGTGGIGGGIYVYNSSPDISENEILNNQAEANGGGIAVYYNSEPTIYNNLIIDNEADSDDSDHGSGGGIFVSSNSNIKIFSGSLWNRENVPSAVESTNTYSGNTHYDGDSTDSLLDGSDVYWWE